VLPGEISSASNLTGEDQNQSEKNGVVAGEDERASENQELRLFGNVKLSFGATGDSALRQRKKNNRKKQRLVPEKVSMMNQERVRWAIVFHCTRGNGAILIDIDLLLILLFIIHCRWPLLSKLTVFSYD